MSGWGSGEWGSGEWGYGIPLPLTPATAVGISRVDVLSDELIRVTFSRKMRNDSVLKDPASYTVTPVSDGIPVVVRSVRSGSSHSTTVLHLILSKPTRGVYYKLTVVGLLTTTTGDYMTVNSTTYRTRLTKSDRMVSARPSMYDTRITSVYRALLTAIGQEDDLIGGERDE